MTRSRKRKTKGTGQHLITNQELKKRLIEDGLLQEPLKAYGVFNYTAVLNPGPYCDYVTRWQAIPTDGRGYMPTFDTREEAVAWVKANGKLQQS